MREQRAGHIINISSVAGGVGLTHCSAYSASKFAVEGLSMAIASEVERFGIKMTTREHDKETWASYDGTQQGDPLKLGQALVRIAAMDAPLKLFVAGSDAIEVLLPVAQARVRAIEDNAALSGSTDGS